MHTVWRTKTSVLVKVQKCTELALSKRLKSVAFRILDGKFDYEAPRHRGALDRNTSASNFYQKLVVQIEAGGSPKAIQRYKSIGKLLVQDRLKLLLDEGSDVFNIGQFAGLGMDYGDIPSGGGVSLIGKINGQYCLIMASNSMVKGGTSFPISVKKQIRVQEIALQNRLPSVFLIDSGGAFLPLQSEIFPDKLHGGRVFRNEAVSQAAGLPQIAVVCGSCTAGGAYVPVMCQECIMVKGIGFIYLAGPPLLKAATGEEITDDLLGGADVHCRVSGCADRLAETEKEAYELCREVVATLNFPQINFPEHYESPLYSESELGNFAGLVDVSKIDIFNILARLLDASKFREFKAEYGLNLITGFGYIGGMLVGLVANCGKLTSGEGLKGAHFIWICGNRKIPLIFLQYSTPCSSNDKESSPLEDAISLKDKAKMMSSLACVKVPKIAVNIGGCYGDDCYTMSGRSFNPNFLLSWPSALTSENFPTKEQVLKDGDLSKVQSSWDLPLSNAFSCAADLLYDAVILPEETRKVLIQCLRIVKHGEIGPVSSEQCLAPVFRM